MLAIRSLLRANRQIVKTVAQPARNMSVVAIPPRHRVSKGEVIFLSTLMMIGWCVVPAWVLVNIKHYRAEK